MAGTGWLPGGFDGRDKYYKIPYQLDMKSSVDLRKEYPQLWAKPYDQGNSQSCVANASAAAFGYQTKREGLPAWDPSRVFIWWNARTISNKDNKGNVGCNCRHALKSLDVRGVCQETTLPFKEENWSKEPTDAIYSEAKGHTIVEYSRLDADRPDAQEKSMTLPQKDHHGDGVLAALRFCLSEGFPVVFGFWYYWEQPNWESPRQGEQVYQLPKLPHRHEEPPKDAEGHYIHGGHSVLAIGYDNKREQILCQNSWGPQYPGGELFWMHYDWITDFEASDDFWMIRREKQ